MKPVVLFVAVATIAAAAAAQPVIDASYFLAPGLVQSTVYDVSPAHYPDLAPIVAAVGNGQVYDFSSFTFIGPYIYQSELRSSTSGTPGAVHPALGAANYVFLGPNVGPWESTSYFSVSSSSYSFLGSALVYDSDANGAVDTTWTTFSPARVLYELPLLLGKEWNQSIDAVTTSPFGVTTVSQSVHAVVEGWGSLVLPDRTLDALRLRTTTTQTVQGSVYTTAVIDFLTPSGHGANIFLDVDGNPAYAARTHSQKAGGGVGREEVAAPGFELHQNYPNPVRTTTFIPINLETAGAVRLSVFDLLGREVARPLDGFVTAGRYDVPINADTLPDGVYLYRLSSGTGTLTRQMVVSR